MHALTLIDTAGPRPSPSLTTIDPPVLAEGHALIGLRLAGICGTDLELCSGYKGYRGTLGHEFVGEVLRCPDAPQWEGRRVTGEINLSCGRCDRCAHGQVNHCAARRVMGILDHPGCFAEQLTLPIANLHAIPDPLSDEHAVFTEPLAAAFQIFEQIDLSPRSTVAVIGDGKLGLLIALALRARQIAVVAVGRHPDKLSRVAGPGIDTRTVQALGDERFDTVVEATGSADGLAFAVRHTAPRGTVVLKSTIHGAVELPTAAVVVDEIRLVGSRCGPFDVALTAMAEGLVDPRPLIDARYPLAQAEAALDHAARRGVLKVLIEGPVAQG